MEKHEVAQRLLWRLIRHGYIGSRHAPEGSLRRGFDRNDYAIVEEVVAGLVRAGILVRKPTGHGYDIFVNPHMLKQAKEMAGML